MAAAIVTVNNITTVDGVEFDMGGDQFLLLSFPKGIKYKGSTTLKNLPKFTQVGDAYLITKDKDDVALNIIFVKGLNKDGYAVWSCNPLGGLEQALDNLL